MRQETFRIIENMPLTDTVFRMKLAGNTDAITCPGQFVNIRLDGKFLRRPISVCDKEGEILTVIYKVVGAGTDQMSRLPAGTDLDLLTGLGNGYDLSRAGEKPLLLGGGVGVPPLYWLAKQLRKQGCDITAVLGFNTSDEVFYEEAFKAFGAHVIVMTVDGSAGKKGFVTQAASGSEFSFFYACGPIPMLKAVYTSVECDGQMSFEQRMGCGFGACMGCSVKTAAGYKRICKEGPVLNKEEILWED